MDRMHILGKELLLEESSVALKLALDKDSDLEHFEVAGGRWWIEDGCLTGEFPENGGGLIYSKMQVEGDILMDFYGELVPPCNNDLNWSFKTEGWAGDDAGRGYILGLNGWYDKKAGIEKYPPLADGWCAPSAQTAAFQIESGRRYHIQSGCAKGHCFIFVDGKLIVEMFDPSPSDFDGLGRFGFGCYCSKNRYSDLTVYNLAWRPHAQSYIPAFSK